jgi:hypothetical protein
VLGDDLNAERPSFTQAYEGERDAVTGDHPFLRAEQSAGDPRKRAFACAMLTYNGMNLSPSYLQ